MKYSMLSFLFICFLIQSTASTNCQPGQYYSGGCYTCSPGVYCPGDDNSYYCPMGYYSSNSGMSSCTNCGTGYSTPSVSYSSASGCFLCYAGYYLTNSGYSGNTANIVCQQCAAGTYNPSTGQYSCTSCPAGTANPVAGSTSVSACINCLPGYYSVSSGTASCSPCPVGTYNSQSGQSSCNHCPTGQCSSATAATSASVCAACPIGKYPASDQSSCISCLAGTYGDPAGSGTCLNCPLNTANPNSASSSSSACIACGLGLWLLQDRQLAQFVRQAITPKLLQVFALRVVRLLFLITKSSKLHHFSSWKLRSFDWSRIFHSLRSWNLLFKYWLFKPMHHMPCRFLLSSRFSQSY